MSLLRQLLLSVTVAIIAILIGTLVFSVNGARNYLNSQLQAESDNAATSLALTLSQPGNQEQAVRELLVTALFDSGQFHAIELHDTQGREIVSRRTEGSVHASAPDWFSNLLPLRAPRATRDVSDGWTQVGQLTIIADDSEARNALWNSSIRVLGWVALAGVLWLAFVVLLMRWLKRALHDEITKQVDSIADGQAAVPGKRHRHIADLLPGQHVVTQARERVQASKHEADARIESLTLELNHDAVSGLPNRRYFMNELRRALQQTDQVEGMSHSSHVLLCRQRDLAAMAAALPREQVDGWLHAVGDRLQKVLAEFPDLKLHVGRLNGSDVAVLIPDAEGPQAMRVAQAVRNTLLEARIQITPGRQCRWAFAMTDFFKDDDLSVVFSRLDTALMASESAGHSDVETLLSTRHAKGAPHSVVGEAAWRTLLGNALSHSYLGLSVKPANYSGRAEPAEPAGYERYESTLTISDPSHNQGESLSGFAFMPAAVRLGLSAELDARAVQLALDWLGEHPAELAVRVSVPSLLKPEFLESLRQGLDTAGAQNAGDSPANASGLMATRLHRLIIELDAYGLSAYPSEVQQLCTIANNVGVRVGLRGVAQQLDAIARLQGLPVAYLKLGGGFLANLETSQGAVSLLDAVIRTATALGIKVLVDDTPSEIAATLLRDHGAQLRT